MLNLIFSSVLILCLIFYFNSFEIMIMLLFTSLVFFIKILMNPSYSTMEFMEMDLMSEIMILLSIWITFLMLLSSFANKIYMNKFFLFYVMAMLFLLEMCFTMVNLMMFYFFFESSLFPMIMIIFGWGNQPERIQAGYYMLMYTIFGSFPMFIMIINYFTKNFSLLYIYMMWLENLMLGMIFSFLMLGFLVKIPMFFFHLWLPKAHVEAPIAGSMILAGILLKLGIYGIFRFKNMILCNLMIFSEIIMVISVWGSVMISMYCLFQVDIKSLIAYSSVCHMGMVLGGSLTFSIFGSMGSLLLMTGHGLISSGMFCLANILYERTYTRSMLMLKGIMKVFPSLTLWWFLFSIANMSAPMTLNILGEFFLSLSMLKYSIFFFFPLMLIIFLSACYSMYLYGYLNHGNGWVMWSMKLISMREYNIMFLHLFLMIFWFLKFYLFCKWV
uniref:NADH-ubiquinone oxidoreductase chain 4 n=1 Tax=Amblyomma triguttatum TaxID=65637 RepID=Q6I7M3_9ACAR|nr:NADH dehydrogenase subunit 4 [Amblyomma triguttatum]BAD24960.1 NADH dehydrogenase subunit 4 [Amblyomma triguttatum]